MTLSIMLLDMLKLRRLPKSWHIPIQMSHPFMQCGIAGANVSDITFEMLHIHGVEADDGGVEADVCFCDFVAKVVWCCVLGEMGFGAIEGGEERSYSLFVGVLRSGRTSLGAGSWRKIGVFGTRITYVANPDL